MPGTRTLLPSPFAVTFCFSRWAIHFKLKELMANPVGAERDIMYHWQNPKVINRFGVLNGMHNRASVQLTMKYRQAAHEGRDSIRIANIELVISELTGDVRLQVVSTPAYVYQMRGRMLTSHSKTPRLSDVLPSSTFLNSSSYPASWM